MQARSFAAHQEALDCELLQPLHSLAPVLPLPADDDAALPSVEDTSDLAWLLPLLDSDVVEYQSATASPSRQHIEFTCSNELLMSPGQTYSDDCTSDISNSSSECTSPLEHSDDVSSPHASPRIAPPAASTALTSAKKPVFASTHARQKHEKAVLTQEAQELEATLARLQTRASTSSTPSLDRTSALIAHRALPHSAWRHVAETERALLQRSTRTNKRLRARLDEHKRLSKSLQRMLLDRAARAALLSEQLFRPSAASFNTPLDLSPLDIARLQDMVRELDRLHATAGAALDALEAEAPARGSYRQWQAVQSDARTPARLRVISCDEIPFDGSQIQRALERYRKRSTPGVRVLDAQRFGGPRDVFVVEEVGGAFAPLGAQSYRHRRVSRSFAHNGRASTVSTAYIESVDATGRATPDVCIKVQMWITGREHAHVDDVTGACEHSSTILNATTLTPMAVHDAATPVRTGTGLVDNVLMPLWDREIATRVQQLENLLLNTHIHT